MIIWLLIIYIFVRKLCQYVLSYKTIWVTHFFKIIWVTWTRYSFMIKKNFLCLWLHCHFTHYHFLFSICEALPFCCLQPSLGFLKKLVLLFSLFLYISLTVLNPPFSFCYVYFVAVFLSSSVESLMFFSFLCCVCLCAGLVISDSLWPRRL